MQFRTCLAALLVATLPALARADGPKPNDGATVVAKRGTAVVTFIDLDAKVGQLPPEARPRFLDSPKRIEATVSNMLLIKQLAAEAREAGLDNDPLIQADIRYATEQILSAARMKRLAEQAPKIDADALAKEAYLANPAQFRTPERMVARHILFRAGNHSDAEAEQLAEKARIDALAGKKSFADLAVELSEDDTTQVGGGLLPEFGRGEMQKPFEDAAFALKKPGEISPVVKTKFGYHVIQLVESKPGKTRKFEEVKDELVKKLRTEHVARYQQEHLDQLQSVSMEADADAVASLRTRYYATGAEPPPTDEPTAH